jgi:hypothetical protein
MWVKAREREKNKEKHINGAMFLTVFDPTSSYMKWINFEMLHMFPLSDVQLLTMLVMHDTPLSEYGSNIAINAFPTLFPTGKGVSMNDEVKRCLRSNGQTTFSSFMVDDLQDTHASSTELSILLCNMSQRRLQCDIGPSKEVKTPSQQHR